MKRLNCVTALLLFSLASEAHGAKYGYCYVDSGTGADATRYVSGVTEVASKAEADLAPGGAFREAFLDHVRSRYETGAGAVNCETWETLNDARRAAFDAAISGDTMRVRTEWLGGKANALSGQKVRAPTKDQVISAQNSTSLNTPRPLPKWDAREEEHVGKSKGADERAARRATDEAEFQAKEKAYREGVAAHEVALQQYERAVSDTTAKNAASAASAKIQLDEYARKRAAYEADVARHAREQAEYEAKLANPR